MNNNKLLLKFKSFLNNQNYSETTVVDHIRKVKLFLLFIEKRNLNIKLISSKNILSYIRFLRRTNNPQSIEKHIHSLKLFFNCVLPKNNPVFLLPNRKIQRINLNHTLSFEYLTDLYKGFQVKNNVTLRDKVLLGLLIFQMIRSKEVEIIQLHHLDFHNMKITIPSSFKTNERTLDLHPLQIIDLHAYIQNVRVKWVTLENTQLIVSSKSNKLSNVKSSLIRKLRENHHKTLNLNLIRKSVIVHLLTVHDLRKVQYLLGHRYISSTENYKTPNLTTLQHQVENCFPLR